MTKNPRDHRVWTNREVEADAAGYLDAQAAFHEDQTRAEEERAYRDDLERFTERFIAAGGEKRDAASAFKAHLNERAAVAKAADDAAVVAQRRRIARGL